MNKEKLARSVWLICSTPTVLMQPIRVKKPVFAQKWRVDPKVAGPSFVLGDLSTHTYYMSELIMPEMKIKNYYVTGKALLEHVHRWKIMRS